MQCVWMDLEIWHWMHLISLRLKYAFNLKKCGINQSVDRASHVCQRRDLAHTIWTRHPGWRRTHWQSLLKGQSFAKPKSTVFVSEGCEYFSSLIYGQNRWVRWTKSTFQTKNSVKLPNAVAVDGRLITDLPKDDWYTGVNTLEMEQTQCLIKTPSFASFGKLSIS